MTTRVTTTFNGQCFPKRSRKPLDTEIQVRVNGNLWANCWTAGTVAELQREADRMVNEVRGMLIDQIGG